MLFVSYIHSLSLIPDGGRARSFSGAKNTAVQFPMLSNLCC